MRDLIRYFGDTYTIFLSTPSSCDLCEMCDEIIVLQSGTLKTVLAASDEGLAAELEVAPAESAPAPASPKKQGSTRWKMLLQNSGEYEVLDNEEKEGKK